METTVTEHRVKLTDYTHLYLMGFSAGLMQAADSLEKLPQAMKSTPGVGLALATVSAEANQERAQIISKNLVAVAKAGLPIQHYKSITFDPNTAELICEFYDPDLFDSGAD